MEPGRFLSPDLGDARMTLAERLAQAMARIPAQDLLTGDGVEPHDLSAPPTAAAVLVPVTDRAERVSS